MTVCSEELMVVCSEGAAVDSALLSDREIAVAAGEKDFIECM